MQNTITHRLVIELMAPNRYRDYQAIASFEPIEFGGVGLSIGDLDNSDLIALLRDSRKSMRNIDPEFDLRDRTDGKLYFDIDGLSPQDRYIVRETLKNVSMSRGFEVAR